MRMKIPPQPEDATEFVEQIGCAVNGLLSRYLPATLVVVKIDNWFGKRWLGFCGKFLGVAGVTLKTHSTPPKHIRIPPFVPERVVSQHRFTAPSYDEIEPGELVHRQMPSRDALRREAAFAAPGTALVWYSGNSEANGRGSLMVYLPIDSSYWAWYVGLKLGTPWGVSEYWGIKRDEYASLKEEGAALQVSGK